MAGTNVQVGFLKSWRLNLQINNFFRFWDKYIQQGLEASPELPKPAVAGSAKFFDSYIRLFVIAYGKIWG